MTPAAGQNASMFVLDSAQGRAAGRANAVTSATDQPAGHAESVTFTASRLDHYAFVVLNESGSGSATIDCTSTRPRPWLS